MYNYSPINSHCMCLEVSCPVNVSNAADFQLKKSYCYLLYIPSQPVSSSLSTANILFILCLTSPPKPALCGIRDKVHRIMHVNPKKNITQYN